MQFITPCSIPQSNWRLSQQDRILLLGSCFAENIGKALKSSLFDIDINPFGIAYNPHSISVILSKIIENYQFTESDLFLSNERWNSPLHHSSFSKVSPQRTISDINIRIEQAHRQLCSGEYLFITFGTAFFYRDRDSGSVVSNCHKLPSNRFIRERLDVDDIVDMWEKQLAKIFAINPKLRVLFTVSPVRHLRDGLHDNNLSKSTLLLAVDKLISSMGAERCSYFPSYEIAIDTLRDYRFFERDMAHPNSVAVEYIWEQFCAAFLSDEAVIIKHSATKLQQAIEHRPFNPYSESHLKFLIKQRNKVDQLINSYPYLNVQFIQEYLKNEIVKIELISNNE